jgi:hypothetical protein
MMCSTIIVKAFSYDRCSLSVRSSSVSIEVE